MDPSRRPVFLPPGTQPPIPPQGEMPGMQGGYINMAGHATQPLGQPYAILGAVPVAGMPLPNSVPQQPVYSQSYPQPGYPPPQQQYQPYPAPFAAPASFAPQQLLVNNPPVAPVWPHGPYAQAPVQPAMPVPTIPPQPTSLSPIPTSVLAPRPVPAAVATVRAVTVKAASPAAVPAPASAATLQSLRPVLAPAKLKVADKVTQVEADPDAQAAETEQASAQTWFRRNTSGAVSLVVHMILLIILALVYVVHTKEPNQVFIYSTVYDAPVDGLMNVEESQVEQLTIEEMTISKLDTASMLPSEIPSLNVSEPTMEAAHANVASGILAQSGGGGEVGELAEFAKRLGKAGAKTGDIQISLLWNNYNDLDLYVITPNGEPLFFGHRYTRCNGELDVDMNAGRGTTREPVENIYWGKGKAPFGKFRVAVHNYRNHGDPDPTSYELKILVDGQTKVIKGKLSAGDPRDFVYEFERSSLRASGE